MCVSYLLFLFFPLFFLSSPFLFLFVLLLPSPRSSPFFSLFRFFFFLRGGGGGVFFVVDGGAADRNFLIFLTTSLRSGFFFPFSLSLSRTFSSGFFFFSLSYRLTMQNQLAKMKEVELFLKQLLCLLLSCFRIAPCVAIEAEYHGSFLFHQPFFFFPFVRTLITFSLVFFFFWFYDFISNDDFYFLLINGTLITCTAARGALSKKKKGIICPNGVLSSAVSRKLHEIEWSFFRFMRALKKGQTKKNPYTHFFFSVYFRLNRLSFFLCFLCSFFFLITHRFRRYVSLLWKNKKEAFFFFFL